MRSWFASVLVSSVALAAGPDPVDDEELTAVPLRREATPLSKAVALAPARDLVALAHVLPDGRYVAVSEGIPEPLTLDPTLQRQLDDILRDYQVPWGAVVALDPSTGRTLAMAEHSEEQPELRGLCTLALYPAASLFKLVTAKALLECDVPSDTVECVHGGQRRLTPALLESSADDSRCLTFSAAMGQSSNVVFARLTARHLDPGALEAAAAALHFNSPFPFPVPVEISRARVPRETWELALTGAGFGDVYVSPIHAAALAAAVASRGLWRSPVLFERDLPTVAATRVLAPGTAEALVEMMHQTITSGTGRRVFHERHFELPDAAGKTGSLSDKRPFRDYSWFIGFAPVAAPKIAVAAVVVNDPYWRIRATWLGREAMRLYLEQERQKTGTPPGRRAGAPARDGGVR